MENYCSKCGNTGRLLNGKVCECGLLQEELPQDIKMYLPYQYRNVDFEPSLVSPHMSDYYRNSLATMKSDILSGKLANVNLWVSAPPNSSKSIFAHSLISDAYKNKLSVFPHVDALEARRILLDLDYGKEVVKVGDIDVISRDLVTALICVIKVPVDLSYSCFDAIKLLIDRRRRVSHGVTLFLSDMPWSFVKAADKKGLVKASEGDGSFGTILIKDFYTTKEN